METVWDQFISRNVYLNCKPLEVKFFCSFKSLVLTFQICFVNSVDNFDKEIVSHSIQRINMKHHNRLDFMKFSKHFFESLFQFLVLYAMRLGIKNYFPS
jgi:hypothetical protein